MGNEFEKMKKKIKRRDEVLEEVMDWGGTAKMGTPYKMKGQVEAKGKKKKGGIWPWQVK